MEKQGKRYAQVATKVDPQKLYSPQEGVGLAKETATAKFDETVELHLRMGVDPRHADQQVRGVALLPNGLGKEIRVLVFATGEGIKMAEDAGADFVGGDELAKQVEDGWTDFDIAIATPEMMGKIGKLGRVLGRKGLMPNPRSGTVVPMNDLPRAVRDARKGRVEFRVDRTSIIHVPVGKASFEEDRLLENVASIVDAIVRAKPTGAKGTYIKTASLSSTMGPGIHLDVNATQELAAASSQQ